MDTYACTVLGLLKLDSDPYERYQDFDTVALRRISSRIHLAGWFGLGNDSGKISQIARKGCDFAKLPCHKFWNTHMFNPKELLREAPKTENSL